MNDLELDWSGLRVSIVAPIGGVSNPAYLLMHNDLYEPLIGIWRVAGQNKNS